MTAIYQNTHMNVRSVKNLFPEIKKQKHLWCTVAKDVQESLEQKRNTTLLSYMGSTSRSQREKQGSSPCRSIIKSVDGYDTAMTM